MVLVKLLAQSAGAMPPDATTMLAGGVAELREKSVVSPVIDNVMGLPSPPVTLIAETTIPAATLQASVALDGLIVIARGAGAGDTVIDSVPETDAA